MFLGHSIVIMIVRNHAIPIANITIPKPVWIQPVLTFLKGSWTSLVTGEESDSNLSLARSFIPSCSLILLKDMGKQGCCGCKTRKTK